MMEKVDLKALIERVSDIQNPLDAVAKKTFEDYMFRFQEDGQLRNGILNLNGVDESDREEFIKLVGQFDKQFCEMMTKSIG